MRTASQEEALKRCRKWLRTRTQLYYLTGCAGTGKTTLAQELVEDDPPGSWKFAALTGKAAHVLRQKGCEGASTIHSLIYRPNGETNQHELKIVEIRLLRMTEMELDKRPEDYDEQLEALKKVRDELRDGKRSRFARWEGSPLADPHVRGVVVDECSMIDADVMRDLKSFGKKILALGDQAQLPPVGKASFFKDYPADFELTEIHRQAAESGILRLATLVRQGGDLRRFQSTDDCAIISGRDLDPEVRARLLDSADQILCGTNAHRHTLNKRCRVRLGRTSLFPEITDRLVCLRNDRSSGLYNGSQWRVLSANTDPDTLMSSLRIQSEDSDTDVDVESWAHYFAGRDAELRDIAERRDFQEFDYGYAMTVHKAQGSQWGHVVLMDDSAVFGRSGQARPWLYTGITRASVSLKVIT